MNVGRLLELAFDAGSVYCHIDEDELAHATEQQAEIATTTYTYGGAGHELQLLQKNLQEDQTNIIINNKQQDESKEEQSLAQTLIAPIQDNESKQDDTTTTT